MKAGRKYLRMRKYSSAVIEMTSFLDAAWLCCIVDVRMNSSGASRGRLGSEVGKHSTIFSAQNQSLLMLSGFCLADICTDCRREGRIHMGSEQGGHAG